MAIKILSQLDASGNYDLAASDIPSLAASKITSGTFSTSRIPSLAASKITSGTFATARIADNAITAGKLNVSGNGTSGQVLASDGDGSFSWVSAGGTGTVTQVTVGSGLDISNQTTTPYITLDLSELTDMTAAVNTSQDELILLDNGAERRKLFSEIFGSNAYNSTTIPTNNNQLTNGAGYLTAHPSISAASSSNNSGRTYIQDITLDSNGHVTGITTATETVTNTNTQLSNEQVQDIVGGMVSGNTETNISVTYDDTNGKLNFSSTDTNTTYSTATSSTLGLVKIGYSENGKNYPVELSSGQMYVNVPWTDTNTTYSVGDGGLTQKNFTTTLKNKLDGIAASANNYSLPAGSSSTRGGFKIGYTENGKNYPVEVSSEKMYVNVPWTDTNTTYSAFSGEEEGLVPNGSGRDSTYFLNGDGNWAVPPDTNTNTTYSAGSGLDLSGTTFSVETDLRDGITRVGKDTSNYILFNTGSIDFYAGGVHVARLESDGDLHVKGDVIAASSIF